ncbi:MAG: hypothetical protein M1825_001705 [Sarcosagium campestre]|nr:MAG: hypothetical protein M1825_001705 [Sarcosagium campestre]
MPAPSLYETARKMTLKNLKYIMDVGEAPYEKVRDVLIKLDSPEQLRRLEEASPQICGPDAEIWRAFIARDIPQWWTKTPQEPKNPQNWHKLYKKFLREKQADMDKDAEKLKAAMDEHKKDQASHTSRLVDTSVLPNIRRNTALKGSGVTRTAAGASRESGSRSVLTFSGGSKTKTTSGKSILDKARREAREMSHFSARNAILSTPTHRLADKATPVTKAPSSLVDDYRRSGIQFATNIPRRIIRVPRRTGSSGEAKARPSAQPSAAAAAPAPAPAPARAAVPAAGPKPLASLKRGRSPEPEAARKRRSVPAPAPAPVPSPKPKPKPAAEHRSGPDEDRGVNRRPVLKRSRARDLASPPEEPSASSASPASASPAPAQASKTSASPPRRPVVKTPSPDRTPLARRLRKAKEVDIFLRRPAARKRT